MNARDELVGIIMSPERFDGGPASCGPGSVYAARIADAILAAGYSKPRTITTLEELDALANGSIILEVGGNPLRATKRQDGKNWWLDGPEAMSGSPLIPLPVTVLYTPKESQ